MSTEANGRTDPLESASRGSSTPRVQVPARTRHTRDITDATDQDLAARARALWADMPRRGVGPVFPDLIRARARRHRSRARVLAVAALVLVIAVGVSIPVGLRVGGNDRVSAAAAPPAVPYSFGGVTVTWLPAAMTHDADIAAQSRPNGHLGEQPDDPPLSLDAHLFSYPASFVSRFVARSAASTPAAVGLSTVWVSVIWQPKDRISATLWDALKTDRFQGRAEVSATTMGHQPATFLSVHFSPGDIPVPVTHSNSYGALLTWYAPDGTLLGVEANSSSPVDVAVLRQIGAGLVLGQQPPTKVPPTESPAPTTPPDAGTAAAVKAAIHDVFTHGLPADRFAAALQDGQALTAVRARVFAHFPQMGDTVDVTVEGLNQVGPDRVEAQIILSFVDPTVTVGEGQRGQDGRVRYPTGATAIRTADGWKVSRDSYCPTVSALGVPELDCPPA